VKSHVIVVAGGSGTRMNATVPKQFILLKGRPLLFLTLETFYTTNPDFFLNLVLPEEHLNTWKELLMKFQFEVPHRLIVGGATRFHSVKCGLQEVSDGLVAVHDGVRPLVSSETINRCFSLAKEKGSGVPAVQSPDSIRLLNESGSSAIDRNLVRLVQTPQCFRAGLLKQAYNQPYRETFTDCASVWESSGQSVFLTEGNSENIKITHPQDLIFAEAMIR